MWGFLSFQVEVTSNRLWTSNYSSYQLYLHNRITDMKSEGLGYRRIAKRLNEEGLKTVRGKEFVGASIHSILKKKRLREERINEEYERKDTPLEF